jgi:hypothetical protein
MGVGTGRFNRVSVWVSLHRLLLTSKAAPGARGAGTAVRSGRHRVRRPGASGPRSRVLLLGSVHALTPPYIVIENRKKIGPIHIGDPDDWVMRGVIEAWQR